MQDASSTVIYEQPLNEYVRVCLRLEHLFKLINLTIHGQSDWESRYALSLMIDALNVIDRPDLKSKLSQALSQHAASLTQLEEKPHVNKEKLRGILIEIDQQLDRLYKSQDKIGFELRNNPFLANIRQHTSNPGGAAPYATAAYFLWLQQPAEERIAQLEQWNSHFDQVKAVSEVLLRVVRGSTHPQPLIAQQGFYQQALDPKMSFHLIRVSVLQALNVYPEISVGKHRLSVRFLELNTKDKAAQAAGDIPFELSCCMALVGM